MNYSNIARKIAESNRDWLTHYHQNTLSEEFIMYSEYYKTALQNHKKILIIEDDFISFELMQKFINDHDSGVNCFFASNEKDALEIVKAYDCDLVIADYFLENNETGLSICQKIKSLKPQAKCLIISSLKSYQYQEILKYSNIEPAFLEKPISKYKIVTYLNEVYGSSPTG